MPRLCAPPPPAAPEHRRWRRLHGLQLPLHPQQVAGWAALLAFAAAVFFVLVPALGEPLRPLLFAVLAGLFLLHLAAHLTALLLDPADAPLRRLHASTFVPEFDRTKHAHVIENGRCHLCNIETSGVRTKHCSVCNKCVGRFDHHCKWLNHCIGGRNYAAFLVCVVSAVTASTVIVGVAVAELVLYHVDQSWLNLPGRPSLRSPPFDPADLQIELHDQVFLFIVGSIGILAAIAAGLLLHLCLFHVYISVLGITTYEYIRSYRQMTTAVTASTMPSASQSEAESIKKLGSRAPSSRLYRDPVLKNSNSNCYLRDSQSDKLSVDIRSIATPPVRVTRGSTRYNICCRHTPSHNKELNLETVRERARSPRSLSLQKNTPAERRCSVETVEVTRRRYCCPFKKKRKSSSRRESRGSCKSRRRPEIDVEPPIKKTVAPRGRTPHRLSTFVVRRLLTRMMSRGPEAAASPVRRNQVRPSDPEKIQMSFSADASPTADSAARPPERSASLPALPPPTRRHIQSVSLKELGDVLAYVQQPRKAAPRRYPLRRKSIPTLRPTMSPTLSPIHESGLSNPSTPQLAARPRPASWLAVDSYI